MSAVEITLSGAAVEIVREGNWPNEEPAAWAVIHNAPAVKRGFGTTRTVELPLAVAEDLADYLWSVGDVNTVGEGRSAKISKTAFEAAARIRTVTVPTRVAERRAR